MNKVILLGRLVRDPELRVSQSENKVARYTLAVNRLKRDEADFIPCVAFGKAAEFAEKYFRKGQQVLIEGRLQISSYTDKNGSKRTSTDVLIDTQHFADSKRDSFTPTNEEIPDEFVQDGLPF